MDSSNIDNHSIDKHFLQKYYPRFSKISRICEHLNPFFVLLYDCVLSLRQFVSTGKPLKNDNVTQLGTGRNPTNPLYSDTTKHEFF